MGHAMNLWKGVGLNNSTKFYKHAYRVWKSTTGVKLLPPLIIRAFVRMFMFQTSVMRKLKANWKSRNTHRTEMIGMSRADFVLKEKLYETNLEKLIFLVWNEWLANTLIINSLHKHHKHGGVKGVSFTPLCDLRLPIFLLECQTTQTWWVKPWTLTGRW